MLNREDPPVVLFPAPSSQPPIVRFVVNLTVLTSGMDHPLI